MERIKRIARELTARCQTSDPFCLCDHLGIEVLPVELPFKVKGFYGRFLDTPIIYINDGLADELERRVICAHELGHAVLHQDSNAMFLASSTRMVTSRYEKEADLFAGYLLLDGETQYDCRCNGWTAEQIGQFTGLTEAVVEYCLMN